jgi:hypothetical protein
MKHSCCYNAALASESSTVVAAAYSPLAQSYPIFSTLETNDQLYDRSWESGNARRRMFRCVSKAEIVLSFVLSCVFWLEEDMGTHDDLRALRLLGVGSWNGCCCCFLCQVGSGLWDQLVYLVGEGRTGREGNGREVYQLGRSLLFGRRFEEWLALEWFQSPLDLVRIFSCYRNIVYLPLLAFWES